MTTPMVEASPGLWMTGEFLGTVQERERTDLTDASKVYPGRFKVKVLTGDRVLQVEYKDEPEALSRIGLADWPARGADVTLPVGVRSAKGYTFFFGRGAIGE
jgi:hypothetical protein